MKYISLSGVLWNTAPNLYYLSMVLGALSGIGYAALIPFIMYGASAVGAIHDRALLVDVHVFNATSWELATYFFLICFVILLLKTGSTIISNYVANRAQYELSLEMYSAISKMSYSKLLSIGQSKLVNLINMDIPDIINSSRNISVILINTLTVIGTLGYLLVINTSVFLFVSISLFVAAFTYQLIMNFCMHYLASAREYGDQCQEGVKGLVYGVKELKLNKKKSERFYEEELLHPERMALKLNIKGGSIWAFAESYGSLIAFLVVGIVIFHLSYIFPISATELFGVVMALLYLTSPVGALLLGVGQLTPGKVALKKLCDFYTWHECEVAGDECVGLTTVDHIQLSNICFHFHDVVQGFSLSNISLEFKAGQISFIVGGNGSGKSTLSKLITLHTTPSSGKIMFGAVEINNKNLFSARSFISAIYLDYYLFSKIYHDFDEEEASLYCSLLGLKEKVDLNTDDGRFSTLDLSDGQRKRLALLCLLLEDRKICVFDEWAADQDPSFKEVFYREILPLLKAKEKIVIVVSHDDRFFDAADQLIFMDQGRVQRIIQSSNDSTLNS